jgi:soluble lytic murein transglycosylase-like protein
MPDMIGEPSREIPFTPSATVPTATNPLFLFTPKQQLGTTTEQLPGISGSLPIPPTPHTDQLQAFIGVSPIASTTGRIVRIPGSRKRKAATPVTEDLPKPTRVMSTRLRQAIVLTTVLLIVLITLISLTPLDNGKGGFTLFKNISDWVQAQQANWQFQSHLAQVIQTTTAQNSSQPVTLPPMTLPKSAYVAMAQQDAINAGISPDYFTRQINMESGFNPNAYSPAGAEGIAQFMPSTAAGLGLNPWDPVASLKAAARLMANYSKNYGGNYAMALAAYNGGSGTVQYAVNTCGSNWMNCLPGETRNYIRVIMGI